MSAWGPRRAGMAYPCRRQRREALYGTGRGRRGGRNRPTCARPTAGRPPCRAGAATPHWYVTASPPYRSGAVLLTGADRRIPQRLRGGRRGHARSRRRRPVPARLELQAGLRPLATRGSSRTAAPPSCALGARLATGRLGPCQRPSSGSGGPARPRSPRPAPRRRPGDAVAPLFVVDDPLHGRWRSPNRGSWKESVVPRG